MTRFQQLCYDTLVEKVPAGSVISYAGLARLINHPNAYRAVGSAMNKNTNAPKVPCHRVVKSNGELGDYAFGLALKQKRLQKEGVQVINNKIVDFNKICL
ncbi:MAG: MGMT family protein [Candidatus Thioglobus sp.]|uniref:MGMT family protein n=1 Tax=Candidatus Thioglobus sp. TaxID=2026721 RepID=UPI00262D7CD6|nr:MGMT family protein [Candidatus Thioglobus sp.]MDC9726733.1 MGMT family protein [Candidatus Thioglobus sp.]